MGKKNKNLDLSIGLIRKIGHCRLRNGKLTWVVQGLHNVEWWSYTIGGNMAMKKPRMVIIS